MRILHALRTVDPAFGGPTEGVRQMGGIIGSELGGTVEVLSLDDPNSAFVGTFPLKVHALGPSKGAYGYSPLFTKWLQNHLDDYDVVVINGIWNYNLLGAYNALKKSNTPYFVFTHGMLDPYFNRTSLLKRIKKSAYWHLFVKGALKGASAVLFTCEEERILARKSFSGYECVERVISYGTADPKVDLNTCQTEFIERFPQLSGKRCLLFLSRIAPKKGIDLLIQAAARVRAGNDDLYYIVAGPDDTKIQESLMALAESLSIAGRFIWPGMLTGNMKWGAFACSEAFILPSHQENFGIALAEATACGKPVLTTNKVNIWRELESSGAGIIANDDVDGIESLLKKWLSLSDEERETFSKNARSCFEQRFEARQSAKSIYGVYRSLTTDSAA